MTQETETGALYQPKMVGWGETRKGGSKGKGLTYTSGGSEGKASAYNVGDPGSIPGWGRSSGEGNGNPLQYSYLENPMGEAW